MNLKKIFIAITALLTSLYADANIILPHIMASRMVLQQKTLCTLWGTADPMEEVTVRASWDVEEKTVADNSGNWSVKVQTPKAGGPYFIDFIGKNHIRLNDILIGEVWITAGTTNMEIPLSGWPPHDIIKDSREIIEGCTENDIRITIIQQKASFNKEDDNNCWWYPCAPQGADNISAQAYLFAKKLHEELKIPIGIIQICWTGSYTECWADIEALRMIPSLKTQIADFERCLPLQNQLNDWIRSHKKITLSQNLGNPYQGVDFFDKDVCRLSFDDSRWKTMKLPSYMDNSDGLGPFDGVVWFRKWVSVPSDWLDKKLILSLGPIDDMDVTFVNGEKIGETLEDGKWNFERKYEIPHSIIRGNDLLIAVRVIDGGNGGGICGVRESMCIYPEGEQDKAVSIAGDWKYLPTAELFKDTYYSYDYKKLEFYNRPNVSVSLNMKTISALYNSMIYPVFKYTTAGIIFSQGETNVGRAEEYLKLFPAMVANWRETAGNPNLKFYYSQMPPNGLQDTSHFMREAQRRCQSLIPNSGMVTLMDLGVFSSYNALDKKTVAARFAAWALSDLYNKPQETMGPEYVSMTIMKNKIQLSFSHTGGSLVCKGGKLTGFEVMDSKGSVYDAEAEIVGDKIVVTAPAECKTPKNVRYAYKSWVEKPSLFNKAGLPASSFTTEKKFTEK